MAADMEADSRVRELEAMVQKLKQENKMLLDKKPSGTEKTSNGVDSDEDLISTDDIGIHDGEWLYTSPVRPPTKDQKKLTPSQWLEQDINNGADHNLSLMNTQKVLMFTLDEDEQFNANSRAQHPGGLGRTKGHIRSKGMTKSHSEVKSPPLANTDSIQQLDTHKKTAAVQQSSSSPPPRKIKWTPKAYSDSEDEEPLPTVPPPTHDTVPTTDTVAAASSLKVSWDPSKATATDSDEDIETNMAVTKKWKVKQVVDDDPPLHHEEEEAAPQRKWKVKQVPDETSVNVEETYIKRKVKQVPDEPSMADEELHGDVSATQGRWKVKQVPDIPVDETIVKWKVKQVPDNGGSNKELNEDTNELPQGRWKVKQVPDNPTMTSDSGDSGSQKKWKVKQVPSVPPVNDEDLEENAGITPQKQWKVNQVPSVPVVPSSDTFDEESTIESPQRQWKVKQVPSVPVVPSGGTFDEESTVESPQRQWKVKQVPSDVPPSPPSSGRGMPPHKPNIGIQRSGTFTKLVRPKVEQRGVRMIRPPQPKTASPTSSEEDMTRRSSPMLSEGSGDGGEEPNFTTYPTLTRPGKDKDSEQATTPTSSTHTGSPIQRGVSPHQRGISPVRHGKSPLEYVRKDPVMMRSSRSPSPSLVKTSRSPSPSSLRIPSSPRRSQLPTTTGSTPIRRQLPSPVGLKSPRQQTTPPTRPFSQHGPSGNQPVPKPTQGRGSSGMVLHSSSGIKRGSSGLVGPKRGGGGLVGSSTGQKQPIPVSKSIRGSGMAPQRGGRTRQPTKPAPSQPSPQQDESWLDGCY